MVSQYGSSAGLSFAADLLNAYNQRDYNLINTQMDPIMQVAGAMNPLVGQLQARAELEQARYNTISSAYNPTAPTPGYTTPSASYNYANPLLNAAGQIYSLPQQSGAAVSLLAAQTQTMLRVPIKPSVLAVAVAVPLPPASPAVATPVAPSPAPTPEEAPTTSRSDQPFKNFGQQRSAWVRARNDERKHCGQKRPEGHDHPHAHGDGRKAHNHDGHGHAKPGCKK